MLDKLKNIICNYVDADPENIKPESRFIEDLGFNSYDFMSLLGELEETLDVQVDDEEIVKLHTVGDAIKYFETLQK